MNIKDEYYELVNEVKEQPFMSIGAVFFAFLSLSIFFVFYPPPNNLVVAILSLVLMLLVISQSDRAVVKKLEKRIVELEK